MRVGSAPPRGSGSLPRGDSGTVTLKPVPMQEVEQIPAVQAVLETFKGSRIEAVEEHASQTEDSD